MWPGPTVVNGGQANAHSAYKPPPSRQLHPLACSCCGCSGEALRAGSLAAKQETSLVQGRAGQKMLF